MARCDVCGNDYDKTFQVMQGGKTMTFDSFECAIHLMAPSCEHCGCRILGHPIENDSGIYCSLHCAREAGNPHRAVQTGSSTVAVPTRGAASGTGSAAG